MFKKLIAFTMAELILVMTIIGVVAALILPNLSNNVDEKTTIASVRKIYNQLQTAHSGVISQYGPVAYMYPITQTTTQTTQDYAQKLLKNLQVRKECGFDAGCFDINNVSYAGAGNSYYTATLKDGSSIAIMLESGESIKDSIEINYDPDSSYPCSFGKIYIDIDGLNKGYDREDYDIFSFVIDENEIKPEGLSIYTPGKVNVNVAYTTAWVIKAGNMDYLRCLDELDWDSKKTCK